MNFFEHCTAAVAAGDQTMAKVLERLPAGGFEYSEAKNHLQAQRAPIWCKTAVTEAHRSWLAEQAAVEALAQEVHQIVQVDPEPELDAEDATNPANGGMSQPDSEVEDEDDPEEVVEVVEVDPEPAVEDEQAAEDVRARARLLAVE